MPTGDPIARAFELAKGGRCRDISDIRRTLEREGYSNVSAHLESGALKKQLSAIIKAERT